MEGQLRLVCKPMFFNKTSSSALCSTGIKELFGKHCMSSRDVSSRSVGSNSSQARRRRAAVVVAIVLGLVVTLVVVDTIVELAMETSEVSAVDTGGTLLLEIASLLCRVICSALVAQGMKAALFNSSRKCLSLSHSAFTSSHIVSMVCTHSWG